MAKKPPPRRIPSDDYTVTIGRELYHPHEGEWVEIQGSRTVGELQMWAKFSRLSVEMDAVSGEDNELWQSVKLLDDTYAGLCQSLTRRVVSWNWTDDAELPIPKPDGTIDPFQVLSADELNYLVNICRSEAPAERKNGSSSLPTTSSATELLETTTPASDSAPSPTKRRSR